MKNVKAIVEFVNHCEEHYKNVFGHAPENEEEIKAAVKMGMAICCPKMASWILG